MRYRLALRIIAVLIVAGALWYYFFYSVRLVELPDRSGKVFCKVVAGAFADRYDEEGFLAAAGSLDGRVDYYPGESFVVLMDGRCSPERVVEAAKYLETVPGVDAYLLSDIKPN